MKISIVEVGPRDGLQNEKTNLSIDDRVKLIKSLIEAGHSRLEAGSFVSPQKIPQMAASLEVFKKILPNPVRLSALVPNERGMNDALAVGVKEVAVFTAASETFTQKNINCSIDESFERFKPVFALAKKNKIKVRGYLSTCFGCPYEGEVDPRKVVALAQRLLKMGSFEVSIGDTIGVADPLQTKKFLKLLKAKVPLSKVAMHFHDTRGTALANIFASIEAGIKVFDSSVGGLGGCPYAPGASGNVATEDVIYMLDGMGVKTGVDLKKLIAINKWVSEKVGRVLPSKVGLAGLPKQRL
jgi:hydroxymethylglutaryl-CoA lyase